MLAWREHPVSAWIFEALDRYADQQRAAWQDASWENGQADRDMLIELRTRADAYRAVIESEYEDFCSALGETPENEGA